MAAGSARLWEPSARRAPRPFVPPTSTDAVDRGPAPPPALPLCPASHCFSPGRVLAEGLTHRPSQTQAPLEASAPDKALGLTLGQCTSLFPGSPVPGRAGQGSRGFSLFSQVLSHSTLRLQASVFPPRLCSEVLPPALS